MAIDNKKKSGDITYLPFENKIAELDQQIADHRQASVNADTAGIIRQFQRKRAEELKKVYSNLNAWQTVQVSRHPQRPLFGNYFDLMIKDARQLHGDRCFGDDPAIITALGQIGREKVLIVGQNKGRDTKEKVKCNFGCPNPEGYRKALAKMKLAEKYGLPIVTLIDTPGAYPGIGAEERGQAQAIAVNLMEMSRLRVPIICIVIGEGGSGGALGIGVGDRLAMLEYSYYSVISPEGCAGILFHDGAKANIAAESLKLTSGDLIELGLIDSVIAEPLGGAHRSIHDTVYNVEQYIIKTLRQLKRVKIDSLLEERYKKIRNIGMGHCVLTSEQAQKIKLPSKYNVKEQIDKAKTPKAIDKVNA